MTSLSESWGTTAAERKLEFPCDGLMPQSDQALFRAVSIAASPAIVFRWLCQLRTAPYSYDWIDNGGQRSPATLTPGLENLSVGQEVMRIFVLNSFEKDRHLTLRLRRNSRASAMFGDLAVSYLILPSWGESERHARDPGAPAASTSRLLVKLTIKSPAGLYGKLMRIVLPWGDLIMMRQQLLNLKRLSEQTATNDTHRAA
jgi:hypothetical protein